MFGAQGVQELAPELAPADWANEPAPHSVHSVAVVHPRITSHTPVTPPVMDAARAPVCERMEEAGGNVKPKTKHELQRTVKWG